MDTLQDNHGDGSNVALSVVSIMSGAPNRRSGRGSIAMNNPKKAYEEVRWGFNQFFKVATGIGKARKHTPF